MLLPADEIQFSSNYKIITTQIQYFQTDENIIILTDDFRCLYIMKQIILFLIDSAGSSKGILFKYTLKNEESPALTWSEFDNKLFTELVNTTENKKQTCTITLKFAITYLVDNPETNLCTLESLLDNWVIIPVYK